MSDFGLEGLQNEYTSAKSVEEAVRRSAIPVGVYDAALTFKKYTKSELRADGSGHDGRPELWFTVTMQDGERKYVTTAFLSYADWRYQWETNESYKPGDDGYALVKQDSKFKLWSQLVAMFDKKAEMKVTEQIATIVEMPVQVGIKGKYEGPDGTTVWAFNTNKAEELAAKGYIQVGDGINFFREVKE